MKHICDGHEYSTRFISAAGSPVYIEVIDNYGAHVATVSQSYPDKEYWIFETTCGEHTDSYHENSLGDQYTIEQQAVRWFAGIQ